MSGLGAAVSLVGIAVAGVGLLGLISPVRLQGLVARWRVLTRLPVTASLRIGFAILFLAGAPQCRLPNLVRLVGILEVAGALTLLALGSARLQRFVAWWLEQPLTFARRWCSAALLFGLSLVYAGA